MSFHIQLQSFSDLISAEDKIFDWPQVETFDQTVEWFQTLANYTLTDDETVQLCGLYEGIKKPLVVLPLVMGTEKLWFGSKRYIRSLTNYYTAYYSAVYNNSECQALLFSELAMQLFNSYKNIAYVDLQPMDPTGIVYQNLVAGFKNSGAVVEKYFRFGNWYLEVAGQSFDDYYEERPSRVRSTIKRKLKKLKKYSANIEIKIITDMAELPYAINAYESIYEKSWKPDEPYNKFIREIVEKFSAKGWLRFGLIHIDGKPAAAQIWFVYNGTASIFKLAYSPEFREFSVGSVLTVELMKHVIDIDKVDIVDYLCGDDGYKKDWMSHRRERWGVRAYRKTSLLNLMPIAKLIAKKYLKK